MNSKRFFLICVLSLMLAGCPGDDDTYSADGSATASGGGSTDGSTTSEDAGPDAEVVEYTVNCGAPPQNLIFPAAEVGVRISSPSGFSGTMVAGSSVQLGGYAFGPISGMVWERINSKGELKTGKITPGHFWQSGPISIEPGDNRIFVSATGAGGIRARDSILISTCPLPLGDLQLSMTPDHLFAGESRKLRSSLFIPLGPVDPEHIDLHVVDADGKDVSPNIYKMRDDGKNGCDELPGDHVYSGCVDYKKELVGPIYFRAYIKVSSGICTTPLKRVDVVERLTQSKCESLKNSLQDAKAAYEAVGGDEGLLAAQQSLISAGAASRVSLDNRGVWAHFPNGVLGAISLSDVGDRAKPASVQGAATIQHNIGSRRALVMRTKAGQDETDELSQTIAQPICPPFDASGPYVGGSATLDALRGMPGHGLIALSGHSGIFFGSEKQGDSSWINEHKLPWRHNGGQELYWTSESVNCSRFLDHNSSCKKDKDCDKGSTCLIIGNDGSGECMNPTQADLMRANVVMGPVSYGIVPAFVDHYAGGSLPDSLVYMGSCGSLWNGSMAMAFLGAGADSFAGYTGPVSEEYAQHVGKSFFKGLISEQKTVHEAICYSEDPEHAGTLFTLAGNKSLALNLAGIINADFEKSSMQGWNLAGDARQVTSFCGSNAPQGKYMGLVSSGLGFTDILGEFSQRFCIPEGTQTMTFSWRYYSAELETTCGNDKYQDLWQIHFQREGAPPFEIKTCTVDDMCWSELAVCGPDFVKGGCKPPSDCPCGSCYATHPESTPYKVETACAFEGETVMATEFVQETVNVSALAGVGPVTLTFRVSDQGQATNDTAVLIDNIQFK
ncbi:MAG TPA: hypothetical protein EYN06_07930 [Myxococcales bacterium]|nr:hypothetical protein [Myxococcales bacterium]